MTSYLVRGRRPLLFAAALLSAAAIFLPLWGMTLVSTQYPEGLRIVVYPGHIAGDVSELNTLNHYIGMTAISDRFFVELRLLPFALGLIALGCAAAALVRKVWVDLLPLGLMATLAGYGAWSMHHRLYQFGHDLDPTAPIHIAPFTPPVLGTNQIAQFATYSYFSWGTFGAITAGALLMLVLLADLSSPAAPKFRLQVARAAA
jgi:copper chaperone NosL